VRATIWAAATFLALAATGANAAQVQSFGVAGWSGGVYADTDGTFTHCAVEGAYGTGVRLLFSVNANRTWSLSIVNEAWRLTPRDTYPFRLFVDGEFERFIRALAVEKEQVVYVFPEGAPLLERLRTGRRLRVETDGQSLVFDLDGRSSAALTELQHCADRNRKPAASGTAPAATPEAKTSNPQTGQEVAQLFTKLVSGAGVTGARILSGEETPAGLRDRDVVWASGGIIGMIDIMGQDAGADPEAVAAYLITDDSNNCAGKFASSSTPGNSARVRRAFTTCELSETVSLQVNYLVTTRPQGGHYAISILSLSSATHDEADEAERKIRRAVYRGIGK